MNITRHTNPNGTYRYEIDGDVIIKASKVIYTHATTYTVGDSAPVLFHKTENAAGKAKGYQGWTKTAVLTIQDGDTPAEVAPVADPAPAVEPTGKPTETVAVRVNRAQIEGNEAAALALADRPADQAAVDAAIDAGARWSLSSGSYFLDMPGELSTLAIAYTDFTIDFGSGIDRFRQPERTPDLRAASAYFGRLLRSN